jgi:hypothetical protein
MRPLGISALGGGRIDVGHDDGGAASIAVARQPQPWHMRGAPGAGSIRLCQRWRGEAGWGLKLSVTLMCRILGA